MLKTEHEGEVITLISDDANAENAAIGEAVDKAAPHLLAVYDEIPVDDEGTLRWKFPVNEWTSLMEILDDLSNRDGVNPDEANDAYEVVEDAYEKAQASR